MLDDLPGLQRKVEKLAALRDKALGAYDQNLRRLRKEYGCKTLKEAQAFLEGLLRKELRAARAYSRTKRTFEKKNKKVLDEIK